MLYLPHLAIRVFQDGERQLLLKNTFSGPQEDSPSAFGVLSEVPQWLDTSAVVS